MRAKLFFMVGVAFAMVLAAGLGPGTAAERGTGPDTEAVAQKLVTQSAGVREGDIVLITGGVRDLKLLEDLAVAVRKVGAFPLVEISSERMIRKGYDDVPAKYDSQSPELGRRLADVVTAVISVDFVEDQEFLAGVPPERMAARGKASEGLAKLWQDRKIRQVNLGNGLYPTAQNASNFRLSQEQLAKIFWDGVNVNSTELNASGEQIKKVLASGKEIQITNPNGTDLKVRIERRPVFISDGVITAEETKKGGAANQVWLPAGEVYLAPVPGTAEGKVVADDDFYQGKPIQGLTVAFRGGKVTSMTAKSGLEAFKALYDASGPGKENFAFIDFGINSNVRLPEGSRSVNYVPSGMVTVGIGNNLWAGGDNGTPFGWSGFLSKCTVKVDGKALVENGVLKR